MTTGISGGDGSMQQTRRTFRVFILSTFRDLHAEREYLCKHVFPEIRQQCRLRGVTFAEADFRPQLKRGARPDEAYVQSTLDAVTRQCPYVIGLIGAPYAWLPEVGAGALSDPLDRYPWLREKSADPRTAAEIGMLEGLLGNPLMAERVFFYRRDGSVELDPRMTQEEALRERTERLAGSVAEGRFSFRQGYRTLEEFGAWVQEDLLAALERFHRLSAEIGPIEADRRAHDAFVETRRRAYVEIGDYLDRLDRYTESDGLPLGVVGESGAGKSALLAFWTDRYRRAHPDAFMITHFVGATRSSGDRLSIMRRIMGEIKERYDLREDLPATPEEIAARFPLWLAHVQKERLVLVIDALDQLDDSSRALEWLPAYVQPRVRLIVSIAGDALPQHLAESDWETMMLEPLTAPDRRRILQTFFHDVGGDLSAFAVANVWDEPSNGNPLLLRLRLEELIVGSAPATNDRISGIIGAKDLDGLHQFVIGTFEEQFGKRLVRDFLRLLWITRAGFERGWLAQLFPRDRETIDTLIARMGAYLLSHGEVLRFFHESFRSSVQSRYGLASEAQVGRVRSGFVAALSQMPLDGSTVSEIAWQLHRIDDPAAVRGFIERIPVFQYFQRSGAIYELIQYWTGVGGLIQAERLYLLSLERYNAQPGLDAAARIETTVGLAEFLFECGHSGSAVDLCTEVLRLTASDEEMYAREVVKVLNILGTIYGIGGQFDQAQECFSRCLALAERQYGVESVETAEILDGLGKVYYRKRDLPRAKETFVRAAAVVQASLGPNHSHYATAISNLGAVYLESGDLAMAEDLFQQALDIRSRTLGNVHAGVASMLNNLAAIYQLRSEFSKTVEFLERSLAITEQVVGKVHPLVATVMLNLAVAYKRSGRLASAEGLYVETLALHERVFGPQNPEIALCLNNMAALKLELGEYEEAERLYKQSYAIRQQVLGMEHPDTVTSILNLAGLYRTRHQFEKAREMYELGLPLRAKVFGEQHPGTIVAVNNYTKMLSQMESV